MRQIRIITYLLLITFITSLQNKIEAQENDQVYSYPVQQPVSTRYNHDFTSAFGPRNFGDDEYPNSGYNYDFHGGLDIGAKHGLNTEVYAVADGEVEKIVGVGTDNEGVYIRHFNDDTSVFVAKYMHIIVDNTFIARSDGHETGTIIDAGQKLGTTLFYDNSNYHLDIRYFPDINWYYEVWPQNENSNHPYTILKSGGDFADFTIIKDMEGDDIVLNQTFQLLEDPEKNYRKYFTFSVICQEDELDINRVEISLDGTDGNIDYDEIDLLFSFGPIGMDNVWPNIVDANNRISVGDWEDDNSDKGYNHVWVRIIPTEFISSAEDKDQQFLVEYRWYINEEIWKDLIGEVKLRIKVWDAPGNLTDTENFYLKVEIPELVTSNNIAPTSFITELNEPIKFVDKYVGEQEYDNKSWSVTSANADATFVNNTTNISDEPFINFPSSGEYKISVNRTFNPLRGVAYNNTSAESSSSSSVTIEAVSDGDTYMKIENPVKYISSVSGQSVSFSISTKNSSNKGWSATIDDADDWINLISGGTTSWDGEIELAPAENSGGNRVAEIEIKSNDGDAKGGTQTIKVVQLRSGLQPGDEPLSIVWPSSTDVWLANSSNMIKWTWGGDDQFKYSNVKIEYSEADKESWVQIYPFPLKGIPSNRDTEKITSDNYEIFIWDIPDIPTGSYKIKVTSLDYSDFATSENFEIIDKGTLYTVSGYIKDKPGIPIEDVRVSFTGEESVDTDEDGYYFKELQKGWSGQIIPLKSGLVFENSEDSDKDYREIENLVEIKENQDFTGAPRPPLDMPEFIATITGEAKELWINDKGTPIVDDVITTFEKKTMNYKKEGNYLTVFKYTVELEKAGDAVYINFYRSDGSSAGGGYVSTSHNNYEGTFEFLMGNTDFGANFEWEMKRENGNGAAKTTLWHYPETIYQLNPAKCEIQSSVTEVDGEINIGRCTPNFIRNHDNSYLVEESFTVTSSTEEVTVYWKGTGNDRTTDYKDIVIAKTEWEPPPTMYINLDPGITESTNQIVEYLVGAENKGTSWESGKLFPEDFPITIEAQLPQANIDEGYEFVTWSDGNTSNPRTFNFAETTLNLHAIYKKTHATDVPGAFDLTNHNKVVRDENGDLWIVYESMGAIWLERSVDEGDTWELRNKGKPITMTGSDPSMCMTGNEVSIAYLEGELDYPNVKVASINIGTDEIVKSYTPLSGASYQPGPPVIYSTEYSTFVVWKNNTMNSIMHADGFFYDYYNSGKWKGGGNQIPGTSEISQNPNLICNYDMGYDSFHLVWQESNSTIKYSHIKSVGTGGETYTINFTTTDINSGYSYNSNPQVGLRGDWNTKYEFPIIAWIAGDGSSNPRVNVIMELDEDNWSAVEQFGDNVDKLIISAPQGTSDNAVLVWREGNNSSWKYRKRLAGNWGSIYNMPDVKNTPQLTTGYVSLDQIKPYFIDSAAEPYQILEGNFSNETTLTIPLAADWNWISYNIDADNNLIKSVLLDVGSSYNDYIKSQTEFAQYAPQQDNPWFGSLESMENEQMYKIKLAEADELSLTGTLADPSATPIQLESGWNWIGYLPNRSMYLEEALSDPAYSFSTNDRIIGFDFSADFLTGEWLTGQDPYLQPGSGYMLYVSNPGTFKWPSPPPGVLPKQAPEEKEEIQDNWALNYHDYEHRMIVDAVLMDNNSTTNDIVSIGAFVDDECRGTASPIYIEDKGYNVFMLMICSNEVIGETVNLTALTADGQYYTVNEKIEYKAYKFLGSISEPLELTLLTTSVTELGMPDKFVMNQNYPNPFNPSTNIRYGVPEAGMVDVTIYNMLGQEVKKLVSDYKEPGYYTTVWSGVNNSGDHLASGIYLYRMTAGDFVQSRKMIFIK